MLIQVAARSSPLAKVQVEEVLQEMRQHFPQLEFATLFLETTGDLDQKTSLRQLGATDFFTKELDQLVLAQKCQVAIHSAKDLPVPLPTGLAVVALTKGIDSRDVLVLKEGVSLKQMEGKVVATSSFRREEACLQLVPSLKFVDIRGTIAKRLEALFEGQVDGVVIAEAALIRLGLSHLNRVYLPGETALFQGRLAVVAREGDQEMKELFQCIDFS